MARPIKEGLSYFPHDVDASSDTKLEPAILIYGAAGYAFYFLTLEYIYRSNDLALNVSDDDTRQVFCRKLQITMEQYESILKCLLKHGAFDREYYEKTRCLTSSGVKKRASVVLEKRDKWRERKSKQFSKEKTPQETLQEMLQVTEQETVIETPQSKVKKSKEKKSKLKEDNKIFYAENVSMSETEYQKLIEEFGIETVNKLISVLDNYKGSSGKAYKSDYRAIRLWVIDKVLNDQQKLLSGEKTPSSYMHAPGGNNCSQINHTKGEQDQNDYKPNSGFRKFKLKDGNDEGNNP